jgi:hypothetical protein
MMAYRSFSQSGSYFSTGEVLKENNMQVVVIRNNIMATSRYLSKILV